MQLSLYSVFLLIVVSARIHPEQALATGGGMLIHALAHGDMAEILDIHATSSHLAPKSPSTEDESIASNTWV
eukprot:CAMPEP_0198121652 /NCGR_PEP_ID=MMETSP1442-20131203/32692_1 /TAXON_ID= /ORGANISM="Craspedostauros australis, Strain CCMP3328" /LENGTH=71 /DNA_ID=CAMNT_0043780499 /DNA_START=130 /DNA_END=345 /DNA_ORIENTATION=-